MRTDLGDGIHKVRVAISSKNKGKRDPRARKRRAAGARDTSE